MLYLVRHAQAEPARSGMEDADRVLSREGREDTVLAARGLRRLGVRLELFLVSPLRRAQETARLLAASLSARIEEHAPLAPGRGAEEILQSLTGYSSLTSVALVGHEPDLGQLASLLLSGDARYMPLPFQPGQVAAIEVGSLPPRAPGLLRWFIPQRALVLIGS
jgi:phosphohistidine phosphatase